jgi:Chaperone of endosialidase
MDITKKIDRTALKASFGKNAVPTAGNFADLIEGTINQKEDGIAKPAGEPLSVQADGDAASQKKAINFYRNFADPKPAWTLSLNPRVDPNNPSTAKPGWSISDADGISRLFIDQATGNVGVGTVAAGYKLTVNGAALFTGNYLYANAENAGRLRVGAAWGMPGLYSGDDGAKPLTLGVPAGQKVYLGVSNGDAFVEGGTGNCYFKGNVGIGTAAPRAKLEVAGGAIMPAAGNAATAGIQFPPDPGGGGGDAAWIRFYPRQGESCTLELGTSNDPDDHIALMPSGNVGIGTTAPAGKLHVQTGGTGAWDKLVVNTTTAWGDGANQYVTIGEGGAAGIMFYNPHVVWYAPEARASIRMGRSGGVSSGHWWDLGVRAGNLFSIVDGHNGAFGLSITEGSTVKVNVLQLGDKWRLSGVGDHEANDDWLRLKNWQNNAYWGGFAASKFWSGTGGFSGSDLHLKREVSTLLQAPENVLKLRGVRFKWRDGADRDSYVLGLIAQEVEQIYPEVVCDGPDGMKGINYGALIAPLIETVKQQQAQIGELRAEIQALKTND